MQATRRSALALSTLAALGLAAAHAPAARAQTTPAVFSGTFKEDDSVALFSFNVTTPGTVSLYTTSYAGGTNVNGSVTAAGGFDPILTLFSGTGDFIDENDDASDAGFATNSDPTTMQHEQFDSGFEETLTTGLYTVAITQYDNFANGASLFDGFSEQGNATFTSAFEVPGGTATAPFVDVDGNQRTSAFTLNISNTPLPLITPEPSQTAGLGLGVLGLAGLALKARKRHAS